MNFYDSQMINDLNCLVEPKQVRDFIHRALYDAKDGYFSQRSQSVGVLERSIKFNQLEGKAKAFKSHLPKCLIVPLD